MLHGKIRTFKVLVEDFVEQFLINRGNFRLRADVDIHEQTVDPAVFRADG